MKLFLTLRWYSGYEPPELIGVFTELALAKKACVQKAQEYDYEDNEYEWVSSIEETGIFYSKKIGHCEFSILELAADKFYGKVL